MLDLKCGNPWQVDKSSGKKKPASYTRFLLPFSYALQAMEDNAQKGTRDDLHFHFEIFSTEHLDRERKLYFTSETANVLYERATWARVPESVWEKNCKRCGPFLFNTAQSASGLQVTLAQPWIILFEGQKQNVEMYPLIRQGFLILEAQFDESGSNRPTLDDLIEFNELYRFVDNPYPEHAKHYTSALADFPADFQSGEKIGDCDPAVFFRTYKKRWLSLLNIPLLHDGKHYQLQSAQSLSLEKENDHSGHLACDKNKCLIYADNRTFVWTCAILDKGVSSLAQKFDGDVNQPWSFGHWLRLLNVDSAGETPWRTHSSISRFEREWLKERTYQRWVESGTYYGYCYHSGAMIAPPWPTPPLWYHFGQMYFDQIILLFYLRISLFAFSRNLTRIHQKNDSIKTLRRDFKELRSSFAKFTNLYQFPLISNQQQGIEMYEIARKNMDIDDLFRDVRNEITSTHEFLEMETSSQLSRKANFIAGIGLSIAFFTLPDVFLSTIWRHLKTYGVTWGGIIFDILLIVMFLWSFRKKQPQWLWNFIDNIKN